VLPCGERRWVVTDIIGQEDGLGVENLSGSAAIGTLFCRLACCYNNPHSRLAVHVLLMWLMTAGVARVGCGLVHLHLAQCADDVLPCLSAVLVQGLA